jgi:hypothetical protein
MTATAGPYKLSAVNERLVGDPPELLGSLSDDAKRRLHEFAWVLQELMIDLKTPVDIYRIATETIPELEKARLIEVTSSKPTEAQKMSLNRFIMFPIINTLCRLIELCTAYGKEVQSLPDGVKKPLRAIVQDLESRRIYDFRSTYTAHVLRKVKGEQDRPLTLEESLDALSRVTGMPRSGSYFRPQAFKAYLGSIYSPAQPSIVSAINDTITAVARLTGGIPERLPD